MNTRAIKRLYSGAALEAWLMRLDSDWENFFKEDHLEDGRRIYREGLVREIEVSEGDAIVHLKEEGEVRYAVIDWDNNRPRVRSSTGEYNFGQSLAAAGLYEIEELIGDEAGALPPEPRKKPDETNTNGKGRTNGTGEYRYGHSKPGTVATPSSDAHLKHEGKSALEKLLADRNLTNAHTKAASNGKSNGHAPVEKPVEKPSRRLLLILAEDTRGLVFNSFWKGSDKKRVPALGKKAEAAGDLTTTEREDMIRLASAARKAGFRYIASEGRYRLESLDSAPNFIRRELPSWRNYFDIESGPGVQRIAEGINEAEVTARASLSDGGGLSLDWTVRMGSDILNGDEARRLITNGGATVLLPGRGLAHLQRRAAEAAEAWREAATLYTNGVFPRYLVFSLFGAEEIKLEMDAPVSAWREALLTTPDDSSIPLPELLRPYQRHGARWMSHLADSDCHGMLADEMGLGKTLQVLSLLAGCPIDGLPALVVCPASVIPVWQMEVERFFPHLKVAVLNRNQAFSDVEGVHIWLASYTQLRRHKHLLPNVEFGYAVLDEAQFIKNPDAKVTQACCSLKARRRLALTGTPLENRLLDLWTLFRFLMPGLLGSRRRFEMAVAGDPDGLMSRLRRQIGPFILRRTKADVAPELPEKIHAELRCPLTHIQRSEYEKLTREGLQKLGDNIKTAKREQGMNFLSLLTRLRQACCDPALLPWVNQSWEASGKLQVLVDKLDEVLASGRRAVVFSQFVRFLDRADQAIQSRFPDVPRLMLTGHTRDRAEPVKAFQELEGAGVMMVSLRAGGSGITLTNADYVFLLDPWWNPAVEEQAIDRLHRIGRSGNVFVYRLVSAGTIEERIQILQKEKRKLFGEALSEATSGDNFEESFVSLRDLIALLPESDSGE